MFGYVWICLDQNVLPGWLKYVEMFPAGGVILSFIGRESHLTHLFWGWLNRNQPALTFPSLIFGAA
jgi:hypothetical protein